MSDQVRFLHKALFAGGALERPLTRMDPFVFHEDVFLVERLFADFTLERFLPGVDLLMGFPIADPTERLLAYSAVVDLLSRVHDFMRL